MYVDANTHTLTHTYTQQQPYCSFFVCYVTVSGSHFFSPLSADVVANQAFIVAATAQSLQRQDGAFSAFVPSASASPSVPTPPMRLGKKSLSPEAFFNRQGLWGVCNICL